MVTKVTVLCLLPAPINHLHILSYQCKILYSVWQYSSDLNMLINELYFPVFFPFLQVSITDTVMAVSEVNFVAFSCGSVLIYTGLLDLSFLNCNICESGDWLLWLRFFMVFFPPRYSMVVP
jgi:hypothetical protein